KIPLHYVRMIESDDYNAISDQLYLVPFLRRYATALGLDAEDVASRFVRDVQKAENAPVRMPDPIPMVEHDGEGGRWRYAAAGAVFATVAVLAGVLMWWRFDGLHRLLAPKSEPSLASPAESPAPASVAAATGAPAPTAATSAADDDLRPAQ
ncbi:MAG TPA: helix-turn-helix domain-containing protein, partial [Candidatus Binataceae bacterium]|nr:helix-turn-helix domain-containing protein [Candidatus Binataceae bacterium]